MRAQQIVVPGGLVSAACAVLAGAGYALTPATGPPGFRFGAFGDPWVVPAAAVGGILGGFALLAATVAVARDPADRRRRILAATLLGGFALAAAGGLWISFRADPPLPPSWNWIRGPQAIGLTAAVAALAALVSARRTPRR